MRPVPCKCTGYIAHKQVSVTERNIQLTTSARTGKFHPRRWMFLVSLLLIGYLVQAVLAQDAASTDEPTEHWLR